MRSIMTGYMKRHLKSQVWRDQTLVKETPIDDPFATVTVIVGWTFWGCLKLLFSRKREVEIQVKITGDGVAQKRWFEGVDVCEQCQSTNIGHPHDGSSASDPGYHSGDERICHDCYHNIPVMQTTTGYRTTKEKAIENLVDKDHPGYTGEWE